MKKRALAILLAAMLLGLTSCAQKVPSGTEPSSPGQSASNEETPNGSEEVVTTLSKPVELTIWHVYADESEEWLKGVCDDFNALHDDIHVTPIYQPIDEYETKVMAAAKSGGLPNIIRSQAVNITTYVNEGILLDMTPYINHPEIGIPGFYEDTFEGIRQMFSQWDDHYYAVPWYLGGNVFFYNADMFDELGITPPKTWEELEPVITKVSEHIGKPGFGYQILVDAYMEMLVQDGCEIVDTENMTVDFDSDISKERITWLKDLIDKGVARLVGEDRFFTTPIANGDVGCFVALSGNKSFLDASIGDKFTLGCAPLPQSGTHEFVSSGEPIYAIIDTDPETNYAAWVFMKYMLDPDVNAKCASVFGSIPVTQSAVNTEFFQDFSASNPVIQAVMEQKDAFGLFPSVNGFYDVRSALDQSLEEIILGVKSTDEAFSDAKKTAEAALAQS